MRRRETSKEERDLFQRTFSETRPVQLSRSASSKTPAVNAHGSANLDGRTAARLKRGLVEPDAQLDLHGLTEAVAHQSLLAFLRSNHQRGARLLVVVTGKGVSKSEDSFFGETRGVLKRAVPRWLKEPAFAPFVTGTAPAHIRHGGAGALYVYLRKRRS
jgi:DNA-nicking Smr family endonuclease